MDHVRDTLWVSDIQTVHQKPTHKFDAVITICQDTVADNIGCEYHHFPLSDGPPIENSYNPGVFEYELFEDAVDTIIDLKQVIQHLFTAMLDRAALSSLSQPLSVFCTTNRTIPLSTR